MHDIFSIPQQDPGIHPRTRVKAKILYIIQKYFNYALETGACPGPECRGELLGLSGLDKPGKSLENGKNI